jgi:tetraacyldisaccharide 4'-kinase
VDFVVCNGGRPLSGETPMALRPSALCGVGDFREQGTLAELRGQRVHGVAGIGRPGRFFATLRELGAEPIEHPFPDHHRFSAADLAFDDALPVIMTEKDAVKCRVFANPRLRFLRVDAQLGSDFIERLVKRLP